MTALIGTQPSVVSVEYPFGGGRGGPAGRLRFGVRPPPALNATHDTARGIADPILLTPPPGVSELPNDLPAALRLMATSHVVPPSGRLGVYWETYGYEPADTVELAVWIERYTPQGIVRRFGAALGVTTDLNTPVAVSWMEPQPGYRTFVFREGGVAVIGRSLSLDVSGLPPGEYRLETAVRRGDEDARRGRTAFIVPGRR
jgi:hypothetical protein